METLDEIGARTGTDQSSLFHDYCRTMGELLCSRRHLPVTIMEQGVLGGCGLRMWAEYFDHPDSRIIGIDPHTFDRPPIEDRRVEIFIGSQDDTNLMHQVIGKFGPLDWCTDDGGHFASAQQKAFQIIWNHIKPGGFWCCQDLHTYAAPELCDAPENVMQWLAGIATEMQGRGAGASGAVMPEDKWSTIDTITFRKGLCIMRRNQF